MFFKVEHVAFRIHFIKYIPIYLSMKGTCFYHDGHSLVLIWNYDFWSILTPLSVFGVPIKKKTPLSVLYAVVVSY